MHVELCSYDAQIKKTCKIDKSFDMNLNCILFILGLIGTLIIGFYTSFSWSETIVICQYVSFFTLPFRLLVVANVIWKRCFTDPKAAKPVGIGTADAALLPAN